LKKSIAYLRYFVYLAINWSPVLAWFIIRHEIRGEKKYGICTTGIDDLSKSVSANDREHASIYQPVNYYTAEMLMNKLDNNDVTGAFLDIGCGKGRMLAIAASYGFSNIIGIDFSAQLCHEAIGQASLIEDKVRGVSITVECEDARTYEIPKEVSVIFMFNPFDDLVMNDFLVRVRQTLKENPRKLKILYANPVCRQQLLDAGFSETYHFKKLEWLEGSVFENDL
jgi:SAM-dependent methyltransferase